MSDRSFNFTQFFISRCTICSLGILFRNIRYTEKNGFAVRSKILARYRSEK